MDQFKGKTAFVTGGASGIGLALCRAFGQRGMNVAIADVEAAACADAVEMLRGEGVPGDRHGLRRVRPQLPRRRRGKGFFRIRQGAHPLQQCRRLPRRPDRTDRGVRLGLGDRRQPQRIDPRPADLPAAYESAWRGRPYRQYRLDERGRRRAAGGTLLRHQICRGRNLRGAGGRTGGQSDRRQRAVPELGQDPHARQRPQSPGAIRRTDRTRLRRRQCRAQPALRPGAGERPRSGRGRETGAGCDRGAPALHLHPCRSPQRYRAALRSHDGGFSGAGRGSAATGGTAAGRSERR